MSDDPGRDYLEGSWVVARFRRARKWTARLLRERMDRFVSRPLWKETRSSAEKAPLRSFGTVLVSAVLSNILFLFLLRQPVSRLGLCWRGLLLLVGLLAMRCTGDWHAVREGSLFLRWLFPARAK